MQELLLGIDIGTSACKVAVFTKNGQAAASGSRSYPSYYPSAGWVEQNPNDWWETVCAAVKDVLRDGKISPDEIAGIGVDSQSWAPVFLDSEGESLCNAPLWLDTRSADVCLRMNRMIGEDRIFQLAGNPLQPMYATGKVIWMKENHPDIYRKTKTILMANGYIVYKLTGRLTMDVSQGYSWHCFDARKGCWDPDMAEQMGISPQLLPQVFPCHQIVGEITGEAAKQTGLAEGTRVVAGGVDAACAVLGAGVIHPGECQEQGGQAGGISICLDEYRADPRLILGFHVVPGYWILQGGTTGGGGIMRWFEREFAAHERFLEESLGKSSLEQLNDIAESVPPGSEGVVFLPYMSGERTPIWDPKAKGVFYGLDYSKTKGHMARAAMEGVAYSLRHNIDVAEETGCKIDEIRATGGSANSFLWTQMKADITGKDFIVPRSDMATVLGTALIAGVGTGVYTSFQEAVDMTIRITRTHRVNRELHEKYEDNYRTYRELYMALKDIMDR